MPQPTINKKQTKKKKRIAYLKIQIKQAIESLAKERHLLTNAKLNIITSASLPIDIHEMLVRTADERLRELREQLGSISNFRQKVSILTKMTEPAVGFNTKDCNSCTSLAIFIFNDSFP